MDRSQSKPSWLHLLRDDDLATIGYTSRGDLPMHVVTPYSSFNLCHYTGDDDRRVERCRRMLAAELGVEECNVIVPRQTHSANILSLIDSIDVNALDLEGIDGLITNIPEIVIGLIRQIACLLSLSMKRMVLLELHMRVGAVLWRE